MEQRKVVLLYNECKMCLHTKIGRGKVYRRTAERFLQCCISDHISYGHRLCRFWGGMSLKAKTELLLITGRLSGLRASESFEPQSTKNAMGYICFFSNFIVLLCFFTCSKLRKQFLGVSILLLLSSWFRSAKVSIVSFSKTGSAHLSLIEVMFAT